MKPQYSTQVTTHHNYLLLSATEFVVPFQSARSQSSAMHLARLFWFLLSIFLNRNGYNVTEMQKILPWHNYTGKFCSQNFAFFADQIAGAENKIISGKLIYMGWLQNKASFSSASASLSCRH